MKIIVIGIVVLVVLALGLAVKSLTNLPAEVFADQGQDHWDLEKLGSFAYNSNPPTSGPHDPDWIRPGVYESPQDKYKLLHSLEHGYIVIHYSCQPESASSILSVSAQEEYGDESTAISSEDVKMTVACVDVVNKLAAYVDKYNKFKIIATYNPTIDTAYVLAAWTRLLKVSIWDEKKADAFVAAYRDRGPEQTME